MPIPVTCQCKATFSAKDHLAGKIVKCPNCAQPLAIPALTTAAEPAPLAPLSPFADIPNEPPVATRPAPQFQKMAAFPTAVSTRKQKSFLNGGKMMSGVAMMIGAVVWFVVGLFFGYIFFYPPILFIFGVVAFVNGMMGKD
jgi:hypothetical protein